METLQEFEQKSKYTPAGILKKNVAGLLDAILVFGAANLLANLVIPPSFFMVNFSLVKMGLYYFSVFIAFRMICIFFLSCTIGMQLMRIQYLHEDGLKLSYKEKMLAALMVYINGIRVYNLK